MIGGGAPITRVHAASQRLPADCLKLSSRSFHVVWRRNSVTSALVGVVTASPDDRLVDDERTTIGALFPIENDELVDGLSKLVAHLGPVVSALTESSRSSMSRPEDACMMQI